MQPPAALSSAIKPNVFTRVIRGIQSRWRNRNVRYDPYDQNEHKISTIIRERSNSDLVSSPGLENVGSDIWKINGKFGNGCSDDRICSQI